MHEKTDTSETQKSEMLHTSGLWLTLLVLGLATTVIGILAI